MGRHHAEWMKLQDQIDVLQARKHDLSALDAEEEGDHLSAEWNRLAAESLRNPTPEGKIAEHRAWLAMMATNHLKRGTVPDVSDFRAAEIEQVMDEMRDEALLADRPSHSTEPPPAA